MAWPYAGHGDLSFASLEEQTAPSVVVTSSRPFVSHTLLPPIPRCNGSSVSQRRFPVLPFLDLLSPLFPLGFRHHSYLCLASYCFSSPFSTLFLFSGFLFHLIIYQFILCFLFFFVLVYFIYYVCFPFVSRPAVVSGFSFPWRFTSM